MTTRNFRVHNGISVGDIVIDAATNKITGGATAAPSADGDYSNKKYVDDSIAAISTTAITQGNSNVTVTDSGTGSIAIDLDGTDRLTIVAATTTTATGHSIVMGAGSNSAAGQIKFLEGTDNGTNGVTLIGPASTADVTVTLPAAADTLVGKATTDTFTNKTIDANGTGNSISNIDIGNMTAAVVVIESEGIASNDNDTTLPTSASVKDYVDTQDGNIAADTLTFTNKTIDANGTGNNITNIDIANMTAASIVLESEGIASNDNDTTLPTSASVKDFVDTAISAVSTTAITQLNTSATVSDSGSNGAFVVVADGNTELTVNDTSATFAGNVVISGNLTTNGTTVTNSSTNTTIEDALIELGSGNTGSNANDLGLILERGSTGNNGFMGWDESEDKFIVGTTTGTGASTGNLTITTGTLVANIEGAVTGNADTASALASAVNIGGVSFDGSGAINLPGVNQAGNQNTSGTAAVATAVTAADESSDTSCNLLFVTAATGDLGPKTGTNLTFNSSSGVLTATGFAGALTGNVTGDASGSSGSCTGTAAIGTAVTVTANNTANETVYLTFVDGATGTQGIETDTGLSYNPSTNVLSTTASSAQYADVAERFEADAPMEIGSVVEVGGSAEITEATSEMSEDVFGVISHKPAYMMNAAAGTDESHPFVAMTGRTPVRVTGVVTKGQRLVTSSVKGCARAVASGESISPFNVIGRALESNTEAGIKLVNCAVRSNN